MEKREMNFGSASNRWQLVEAKDKCLLQLLTQLATLLSPPLLLLITGTNPRRFLLLLYSTPIFLLLLFLGFLLFLFEFPHLSSGSFAALFIFSSLWFPSFTVSFCFPLSLSPVLFPICLLGVSVFPVSCLGLPCFSISSSFSLGFFFLLGPFICYYYFLYTQQPPHSTPFFSALVNRFGLSALLVVCEMAEDLDDGEFWLPSQFLAEDIAMDNKNRTPEPALSCFPDEFPYGFDSYGSALGSPVESVVGSTETESDEEDFLAGLTRQMADSSMIQEEGKLTGFPAIGMDNPKPKVLAGSPQSTLCAVGSWSRCSLGSSRGSSNGPSQVSSPPSTPLERKDDALDLLYAAAGQVVRMKLNDEGSKFPGRGLLGPPRKAAPATAAPLKTPCAGYHHNQELAHQQLQNSQFQQLKQQQLMKQQQQQCSAGWGRQERGCLQQQQLQNRVGVGGFGSGRNARTLGLSSTAWPLQQPQQAGSGMRAVFLGGSGTRRESCGTGVFLPRRAGNPADTRKKSACSTVLLPARVVHALNLNLDEMGTAQPRIQGGSFFHQLDHEALAAARSNATLLSHPQKRGTCSIRPSGLPIINPTPNHHHEIRLPQEWTY